MQLTFQLEKNTALTLQFEVQWPEFGTDWSETFTSTLRKFGSSRLTRSAKRAIKEVEQAVEKARLLQQTFSRKSTKLAN